MTVYINDIKQVFKDEKKLRFFYYRTVRLTDLMENSHVQANNVLCCPFHDDSTPSAKLYEDASSGCQVIFCFTENRVFNSYDYVVNILGEDPIQFLLKRYDMETLNDELIHINFEKKDNTFNYLTKMKFFDLIEASKEELPDVTNFLNKIYFHGVII